MIVAMILDPMGGRDEAWTRVGAADDARADEKPPDQARDAMSPL